MKQLLVVFILLFTLECNTSSYDFTYEGYSFSFPMKIRKAESLFRLNERIIGRRIARLDSNECKEIQITYAQPFQDPTYAKFDSDYPDQVQAVSFYHHEDVQVLKEKLESTYGREFEPVTGTELNNLEYYKMNLEGPVTLLLYANSCNICGRQSFQTVEIGSRNQEEYIRNRKISVVAFTYHFTFNAEFGSYIMQDGYFSQGD